MLGSNDKSYAVLLSEGVYVHNQIRNWLISKNKYTFSKGDTFIFTLDRMWHELSCELIKDNLNKENFGVIFKDIP